MDVHRPGISRVLAGFALAAILAVAGCSDTPDTPASLPASSAATPNGSTPASTTPSQKPMLEDPNAIVMAADFKRFGEVCKLVKSDPVDAQGIRSLYQCSYRSFEVVEIRGEEAADGWKKIQQNQGYEPSPAIAKNASISQGKGVAVYADNGEDSTFVGVSIYKGGELVDDGDLIKLGKKIAEQIKA